MFSPFVIFFMSQIPWRRDAFLNDGEQIGVDLVGGYFDGNLSQRS